jgi:FkbM family methyltransferase
MSRYVEGGRLIFDLGMNNGDDTSYYLHRGFNVVALEANPVLCERAQKRFRAAIDDGRLTIVNAAIWQRNESATFYVNLDNDHWSSLDIDWAGRDGSRVRGINIRCVTLASLIGEFGSPHYLKIDVEGIDQDVIEQLQGISPLPLFVSVEDCRFGFQYMDALAACGYNGFKLLDQSTVRHLTDPTTGRPFPDGSSGPFGNEIPGVWRSHPEMVSLYSTTVRDFEGKRLAPRTQWWDIHCTHIESKPQT